MYVHCAGYYTSYTTKCDHYCSVELWEWKLHGRGINTYILITRPLHEAIAAHCSNVMFTIMVHKTVVKRKTWNSVINQVSYTLQCVGKAVFEAVPKCKYQDNEQKTRLKVYSHTTRQRASTCGMWMRRKNRNLRWPKWHLTTPRGDVAYMCSIHVSY